ncbi:hypothetical protein BJ508DRAFT_46310 [Ascobolus immersus RN42]|uniref:Uncharacterized protein n=1 Tax=Ascobolus immersus RN42 TaxID=1160509 RepID=A0A3N4IIK2_ASCIM|nr:hypothetical protein BJ508DRAFT_46310 [Ascobolus immersus RN42]
MADSVKSQNVAFSSLITEKIDFSTWNDARFHARTPPISLKADELLRLVIEKQPEVCSLEEAHLLEASDVELVEIIGTLFERDPGSVDARSFDMDVMMFDQTDHVADILKHLHDKENFDKLMDEIYTIQSKIMRLHGQASAADAKSGELVLPLMARIKRILATPLANDDGSRYPARGEPYHETGKFDRTTQSLKVISEIWPDIKDISSYDSSSMLDNFATNADVHAEFSRLRLDLYVKERAAKSLFNDAAIRCRKSQYKKLNDKRIIQEKDHVVNLVVYLRAKQDTEISLGITYHRSDLGWVPKHELRLTTPGVARQRATLVIRGLVYNGTNNRYSTKKASFIVPAFMNAIALQTIRPWYIKPDWKSIAPHRTEGDETEADPWTLFQQAPGDLAMSNDEHYDLVSAYQRRNQLNPGREGPPPQPPLPVGPDLRPQGWDLLFPTTFPAAANHSSYGFKPSLTVGELHPVNSQRPHQHPRPMPSPYGPNSTASNLDRPRPVPPNQQPTAGVRVSKLRPEPPNEGPIPLTGPSKSAGTGQCENPAIPPQNQEQDLTPAPLSQIRIERPSPEDEFLPGWRPPRRSTQDNVWESENDDYTPGTLKGKNPQSHVPIQGAVRERSNTASSWDRLRDVTDTSATPRTPSRQNSRSCTEAHQKSESKATDENFVPVTKAEIEVYEFDVDSDDDEYIPAVFTATGADLDTVKTPTLTTTFEANYPFDVPPRTIRPSIGDDYDVLPAISTSGHVLAKVDLPLVEFKRRCTPKDRRVCHMLYILKNTAGFPFPTGDTVVVVDGMRLQDGKLMQWGESGMPEIVLGIDQNITVGYGDRRIQEVFPKTKDGKILSKGEVQGRVSKRRWLCQREIFLRNLHAEMVCIEVYDQVPVIDSSGMPSNADIKLDGTYGADVKVIAPKNLKEGRKVHAGEPLLVGQDQGWGEAIAEQLEEGAVIWNVRLRGKKGVKLVLEWVISVPVPIVKNQGTGKEIVEGVSLQQVRPLEPRSVIGRNGFVHFDDIGRGDHTYRVDLRRGPQFMGHGSRMP